MEKNEREKARRDRYRSLGLCTKCGKPSDGGYALCETCREKARKQNMKAYRKHQQEGMCVYCSNKALPNTVYCEKCRDRVSNNGKRRWQKIKASNRCRCGNEINDGKCFCTECREKMAERQREDREFYIENGICVSCHQERAFGNWQMCASCLEKSREMCRVNAKRYASQRNEYRKMMYYKRANEGLCTRCGRRPAENGLKKCAICNAREKSYRTAEIPRSERIAYGLCYICGEPLTNGKKLCDRCSERSSNNISKAWGKRKDDHPWSLDDRLLYAR